MKKELFQIIEIPEGVEIEIDGNMLKIKGPEGENSRKFNTNKLIFEKKDEKIIIGSKKATKREKKMMNTIAKHIKNMISGIQKKFKYKLKACFSHFPISVVIKENELIIKNFLGEKKDRVYKIPNKVDISVDKDIITVSSHDKELAGQSAADIEKITSIRLRDRRIFQDGIFITNKAGKNI